MDIKKQEDSITTHIGFDEVVRPLNIKPAKVVVRFKDINLDVKPNPNEMKKKIVSKSKKRAKGGFNVIPASEKVNQKLAKLFWECTDNNIDEGRIGIIKRN